MLKFVFGVLLVLITSCACYVEDACLWSFPPQAGKPSVFTFRAQLPFDFDQEKAFGNKRNLAISQYIPVYSFTPDRVEATKRKMKDLMKRISGILADHQADGAALSKYLQKELGIDITEEAATRLLSFPNLQNLLEAILTIQESILQSKIVEDPEPIKGKKTAEILLPEPVGTVVYPATEFVTLQEARQNLQKKITQVFWQLDESVLHPVIQVSLGTLSPNLRYDRRENDRRIEEIIRRYPSKLVPYRAGEVLVPFAKVMTEEDVLLLAAHQELARKDLYESVPLVLFALSFMVVLYSLLISAILEPWLDRKAPILVFLSLLISTVLLLKAYLLLTPFSVYGLPFCLLPIVLVLLEKERASAVLTTLLGAMIVSLFSGRSAEIACFFVLGGLLAIVVSPNIRKRVQVLVPAFWVAIANVVILTVFSLDWEAVVPWYISGEKAGAMSLGTVLGSGVMAQAGWAWLGGLASGPAALLVLPVMEFVWQSTSAFKLNQYADLQHPLMRNLLTTAPGTYQHTMSVAYLAEAVGEAIGLNTLLLRTGAYYHDIGKMTDPKLFVENTFGRNNSHEDLAPLESAQIIIGHVQAGVNMAWKAGLPRNVVDFIPQNHGTQLVEYFYDSACKEDHVKKPHARDFRYPGPKPQSVEAAVLMIVDAVEAASRTIQEPSRPKLESLVRFIIGKRLAEGQFDDCSLSTRQIGRIIQVLVDSLEASFHGRVEYPWQNKEKAARDGQEAAEERSDRQHR